MPKMIYQMAANFFPFYNLDLLQDDLLRLEAYKADLSHLNLSLSNLIAYIYLNIFYCRMTCFG